MDPVFKVLTDIGPTAAVIVGYVVLSNKIGNLKDGMDEIKKSIPLCQQERRDIEDTLQGRITRNGERISRIEGKTNGKAA